MNILKLQASNVMNIEAVEIEPNGNSVTLTGKNGAVMKCHCPSVQTVRSA